MSKDQNEKITPERLETFRAAVREWKAREKGCALIQQAEQVARANARLLFAELWADAPATKEHPQGRGVLLRDVSPDPRRPREVFAARFDGSDDWVPVGWWAQEVCQDAWEEYRWAWAKLLAHDGADFYVLKSPDAAARMVAECRYRLHGAVSGLLSLHGINSFGDPGPKFLREWEEIWPESKALWPENEAPEA